MHATSVVVLSFPNEVEALLIVADDFIDLSPFDLNVPPGLRNAMSLSTVYGWSLRWTLDDSPGPYALVVFGLRSFSLYLAL